MKAILCNYMGHKPAAGPLKRSPHTVHTHWREVTCRRCGQHLKTDFVYKDARTEPTFFREKREA